MSDAPLVERGSWATEWIPDSWCWADFERVFVNVTSSDRKVKQENYAKSGAYPIVDQGVELVGGFTDDASLLHPESPPFIVFGDHTRCVKFVTQPFIQGADGVKVLKIAGVEPRYALWALRTLRLPNKGYSRHYQYLRNSRIPIAPLPEQLRIVAKIEELFADLDAAVVALKRVKANLKRYRAAVLKAAVEGRLTEEWRTRHRAIEPAAKLLERILAERRAKWEEDQLRKFKEAGKTPPKGWREKYVEPGASGDDAGVALPPTWCSATTDQLGWIQLGRQRSPKNRSKLFATKYIRAANITESGLDLSDLLDMEFEPHELETYRMKVGDVVLSEASGSPEQVGKPALWNDEVPDCCFQNTVIRLRPCGVRSEFLLCVFKHFYVNKVFANIAGGVGINHLSAAKFSRIAVPLPPRAEQAEIVSEVDRRLSVADAAETQVEHALQLAARLRQAVLRRAFEGKLVPQDTTDEPARVLLERIKSGRSAGTSGSVGTNRNQGNGATGLTKPKSHAHG